MLTPSQPRPLRQTLVAAAAVISFALVCAVIIYFLTEGLLFLRSNFIAHYAAPSLAHGLWPLVAATSGPRKF